MAYNDKTFLFPDRSFFPPAAGGYTMAATGSEAPENAEEGMLWFDKATGQLFVYSADESSSQWVAVGTPGAQAARAAGKKE